MTYINIIFKKRYIQNNNDYYLVQLKNKSFYKITDDRNGNVEVYKYKDGTNDLEYAAWGKNFNSVAKAMNYLNNLKEAA
jgi:hypothetical protein